MENFSVRIQIISIIVSVLLLLYSSRLIIKGKLRVEYSIFWILLTCVLVLFSFWRDGLEFFSGLFGVYDAPNLVFIASIFGIFIYLLHFSIVISKLRDNNKKLSQDIALLNEKLNKMIEASDKGISHGQE